MSQSESEVFYRIHMSGQRELILKMLIFVLVSWGIPQTSVAMDIAVVAPNHHKQVFLADRRHPKGLL